MTAPEGTLAEAFFDPVADGAALTATTTVGTVSYEAGAVTADLTETVTAGHNLEFIALDGTTAMSLKVSDATTTDGVLTWSVAIQPWNDGDLLMVRIFTPLAACIRRSAVCWSHRPMTVPKPSQVWHHCQSYPGLVLHFPQYASIGLDSVRPI